MAKILVSHGSGILKLGTSDFSMSQRREIFDFISKFRIYNCIIISQEHYVKDKEYSKNLKDNDVDTIMKLVVYTWFPYQSSDRCTEVNVITILDSWVISAQGHFTKNTDFFPRKISKSFNGCPINTVVRDSHWYITMIYVYCTAANDNVVRYIKGWVYNWLTVVLRHMDLKIFISLHKKVSNLRDEIQLI